MHRTTADTSDTLTVQQELEASRNHFIDLAESISDLFFALDNNLKIIYWGKTLAAVSGISPENAIGKRFSDMNYSGSSGGRLNRIYREVIRSKKSQRIVYKHHEQVYNLFIYPFGLGVSVIARSKSEKLRIKFENSKTRENELKDIGQYLHNNVGQYVSALSLRCAELEERIKKQQPITLADVNKIHDICTATCESIHDLTQLVFLKTHDVVSDKDVINNICLNVEKNFYIKVKRCIAFNYLPANILERNHLIRFLQEALTNAAKYSGEKEIRLSILRRADVCVYSISDRGRGFDTTTASKGMGLKLMQFNADELSAQFYIRSNNQGTVCTLKLPLHKNLNSLKIYNHAN
jgi:signal transduction histidine kinase